MGAETLIAEARAAVTEHLTERGFTVLDQDWQSPDGPIPIVAEEKGVLVVVEVVTRTGRRYHAPLERVVKARRARLRRAAVRWASDHGTRYERLRVDVVGLRREGSGQFTIEHIRAVG